MQKESVMRIDKAGYGYLLDIGDIYFLFEHKFILYYN